MTWTWDNPLVIIAAVAAAAIVAIVALALLPQTPAFRQLVVGVKADPQLVGLARALVLYLLPIAAAAAVAYVGGWTDARLLPLVPVLIGAIRVVEARIDAWLKPGQNAAVPPPVVGGNVDAGAKVDTIFRR